MKMPEPHWVHVPDDWLDEKRSDNPEIARLQGFLDKNVREEVIRRHLLAEGIGRPGELEIISIHVEDTEKNCEVTVNYNVRGMAWKKLDEATGLYVENTDEGLIKVDEVDMKRVIRKDKDGKISSIGFSHIGAGKAKPPDHFADEYYLRVVTFLKKIGVESITITALTEPEDPSGENGRYIGAFLWPKYGYTNKDMGTTKKEFLKYLQEDKKLEITEAELCAVNNLSRMRELLEFPIYRNGKINPVGIDFLMGDNGKGEYTREVIWAGFIPDIHNKDSIEMTEMADRLSDYGKK